MPVHKLFKLHKDRTTIAGVAVKGNGTVSYAETGQSVRPQGGLRAGKTCVVSIEERLTFQIEDASTASVPTVGASGATSFDAQEMTGGVARGAGVKGDAASSTVVNVRKTFNTAGQPVVEVEVEVDSADEVASGVAWSAGAA
jgi:hypothetical protein